MATARVVWFVAALALAAACGGGDDDPVGGDAGRDGSPPCLCDADPGDHWTLMQAVTFSDPCPDFDIPGTVNLDYFAGNLTSPEPTTTIDSFTVTPMASGTVVHATIIEYWGSPDGFPVYPIIEYDFTIAPDDTITGTAMTSFPYDTPTAGTTCTYEFAVTGSVAPF
jgi:hypothetical protein